MVITGVLKLPVFTAYSLNTYSFQLNEHEKTSTEN